MHMRIVLCSLNSSFTHSNLALRYLRASIRADWPDHHLLEFQVNDDLRQIAAAIGELEPDILAFSCYIWNISATLGLIADLKTVLPELTIILGGPEVGPRATDLLAQNPAINFVIVDEGELALPALLQAVAEEQEPASIPGVVYRKQNNSIASTPALVIPPEQIPQPYRPSELAELKHKLVYYESSRGCPFSCTYCLSGQDAIRFLPLTRVFADLKLLMEADIPLIKFVDRTFNCNPQRAITIMQFLLAERQTSRFHFEICADLLTDDLMTWLADVPPDVFQFEIGVQSINDATLKAIKRRTQLDKLAQNVRLLRQQSKIHLHLDLIAGLPYQDWNSLRKSFDWVIKLRPHMLQLGFLKILPGTEMASQVKEHDLKVSSVPPYEVLGTKWLSFAELNQLQIMEKLLGYYYNSGLLRYTLPYVWDQIDPSPFQWFHKLATHWQENNLHKVAHGREALFAHVTAYLPEDKVIKDLLTIDKARMLASFPAHFKLPPASRSSWEEYLNANLPAWAPRTYKQAFRTMFPVWLLPATLTYLQQPHSANVAVIDRQTNDIFAYTHL